MKSFRRRRDSIRGFLSAGVRRSRSRSSTHSNRSQVHVSWDEDTPNIIVTADTVGFDESIFNEFREEGFDGAYLPNTDSPKDYDRQLQGISDSLEFGHRYAIVAYGSAASLVLEACTKPMPKLCAVVAYYPTYLPNNTANIPTSIENLIIHLAGSQSFDGKERCFIYPGSDVGFAQRDSSRYDPVNANIAWGRTLACLKAGFGINSDPEPHWKNHLLMKFTSKNVDDTMDTLAANARVHYVPTLTGGVGNQELRRFYEEDFISKIPPSLQTRLISRTKGTDHIVDETLYSFKHTQEIPWMLPGVPPTGKDVEVVIVSIVRIRNNKVCYENVYWDQASVLVQVGLLDPNHIPPGFNPSKPMGAENSFRRLPVVGMESAQSVLDNVRKHGETGEVGLTI
ncbi:hypothetical protein FQN57_002708 [Myotisia sp. PD_48]|nr:hypothetical protein FQN57_002708 [Myotisia sp. PD_48]